MWYDLVLRDNRFFSEIMKKPKKWSGSQTLIPIKYGKGLSTVAFNGYDLLPIGQQPVSVNMTFYPSFTATNVSLAGTDLSINDTSMQTIKLMSQTMASRAEDGADDFGNFLQGDGTTFGGKAPNGLANTVDNGTVAATYGGLTRATYSGLNSYETTATNNRYLIAPAAHNVEQHLGWKREAGLYRYGLHDMGVHRTVDDPDSAEYFGLRTRSEDGFDVGLC